MPRKINDITRRRFAWYKEMDPGAEQIGWHRDRPVVVSFIHPPGQFRAEKRHVFIISTTGIVSDLPRNWEDNYDRVTGKPYPSSMMYYGMP